MNKHCPHYRDAYPLCTTFCIMHAFLFLEDDFLPRCFPMHLDHSSMPSLLLRGAFAGTPGGLRALSVVIPSRASTATSRLSAQMFWVTVSGPSAIRSSRVRGPWPGSSRPSGSSTASRGRPGPRSVARIHRITIERGWPVRPACSRNRKSSKILRCNPSTRGDAESDIAYR